MSFVLADIFGEVEQQLASKYKLECVGGGRIEHDADKKTIKVYGYSQVCVRTSIVDTQLIVWRDTEKPIMQSVSIYSRNNIRITRVFHGRTMDTECRIVSNW